MDVTRRDVLKAGVALAAVPLVGTLPARSGSLLFSTGNEEVDKALCGGMRLGSLLVAVGEPRSGKSTLLLCMAEANGIALAHAMQRGPSDMLSIMKRHDEQFIGSLMLNAVEPSTTKEQAEMQSPHAFTATQARDAFLTRWFRRTQEVLRDSGGIFALSICDSTERAQSAQWMRHADYVVVAAGGAYRVVKSG